MSIEHFPKKKNVTAAKEFGHGPKIHSGERENICVGRGCEPGKQNSS